MHYFYRRRQAAGATRERLDQRCGGSGPGASALMVRPHSAAPGNHVALGALAAPSLSVVVRAGGGVTLPERSCGQPGAVMAPGPSVERGQRGRRACDTARGLGRITEREFCAWVGFPFSGALRRWWPESEGAPPPDAQVPSLLVSVQSCAVRHRGRSDSATLGPRISGCTLRKASVACCATPKRATRLLKELGALAFAQALLERRARVIGMQGSRFGQLHRRRRHGRAATRYT